MGYNTDLLSMHSGRVAVGLSGIVGITVVPGQMAFTIKNMGGGTLFIGGATLSVDGSNGYPMGLSEVLTLDLRATSFFTSVGATTIISFIRGLAQES